MLANKLISSNVVNPTYLSNLEFNHNIDLVDKNHFIIVHFEDGDKIVVSRYNLVAGECGCCEDWDYSMAQKVVKWDLYEINLELA